MIGPEGRPGPAQPLVDLIEQLRSAGFALGASELIDATQLLLRLGERELGPPAQDRLRAALKPVLCKDSERRDDFDAVFKAWWERLHPAPKPPGPDADAATPPAPPAPPPPTRRLWLLAVFAAAVVLAIAVYRSQRPAPVPVAQPVPQVTPSGPRAASAPVATATPRVARDAPPIERYTPALRQNLELRPLWFWLFAALPLLAFVALNVPALMVGRQRALRGGQPLMLDAAPLEREARRLVPPLSPVIVDRLARHLRSRGLDLARAARRPRLDERRTVEATLRNRGLPTVRWAATPVHPSYLLLIDVAHERDPRGRLFYQWALRLREKGLDVEIQALRRIPDDEKAADPDAVFYSPAGAAGAERERWRPLHKLRTPRFGQRLIVVSDGTPFVDSAGHWRQGAVRARLHRWADRALFTPLELRDWGPRESALERRETPVDTGFTVLPLDESALASWTSLVLTGHLADITLAEPQRYPALLRRDDSARFADETPPPEAEVERLLRQLRIFLGEPGLRWMAALALTPVLRWELTLLLGRTALAMLPELADEDSLSAALARHYRRLVRLPWLQQGSMPDWLRLRLLLELSRHDEAALRDRVRQLLAQLRPREGREGIPLGFERPPATSAAGAAARDTGPLPPGDRIYLGTMSGLTAEQLLLRAPAGWAEWAGRLAPRQALGLRERLRRARERVRGTWAQRAWVDGLPHLGLRPVTHWVTPVLALPLVSLLIWARYAQVADEGVPVGPLLERRAVPVATVLADTPLTATIVPGTGEAVIGMLGGNLVGQSLGQGGPAPQPWLHQTDHPVRALATNPGGDRLAVLHGDGSVRWYDVATRRLLATYGPVVMGVSTSSLAGVAVSAVASRRLMVVALGRGHLFATDGTEMPLWTSNDAVALSAGPSDSPTGWLALASATGGVNMVSNWDLLVAPDGARLLYPHGSTPVDSARLRLAASSDGRMLALVTADGNLLRWRMPAGEPLGSPVAVGAVKRLAFVGEGEGTRLLRVAADGGTSLLDPATGQPVSGGSPLADARPKGCLASSADGETLVVCSAKQAQVLTARAGRALGAPLQPPGPARRFRAVAFSADGKRLAAVGDGGPVIWDAVGNTPAIVGSVVGRFAGQDLAFVDGGTRLASTGVDGQLRLWDSVSGAPVVRDSPLLNATRLRASADGRWLLTADASGSLQRRDSSGTPVGAAITVGVGQATALALSADGSHGVAAHIDGSLREWLLPSAGVIGQALPSTALTARTPAQARWVSAVAYSADGSLIAAGGSDAAVHVWSSGRTGLDTPRVFSGHSAQIAAVGFDAGVRRLVAVAQDGRIRQWDLASGEAVGSALGGRGLAAGGAAISADGRSAAVPVEIALTAPPAKAAARAFDGPVVASTAWLQTVAARPAQNAAASPQPSNAPGDLAPAQEPVADIPITSLRVPAEGKVPPKKASSSNFRPAPEPTQGPSGSNPGARQPDSGVVSITLPTAVQRWQLDPVPDAARATWDSAFAWLGLATPGRGGLPAGVLWGLGLTVFVIYGVHITTRNARLERGLRAARGS